VRARGREAPGGVKGWGDHVAGPLRTGFGPAAENKAATAQTASLLFQNAFTGHAEMGLAGDNDFSVKVSDGTTWFSALTAARATGLVTLPQGAQVNGPVTGTAVQSSATDATALSTTTLTSLSRCGRTNVHNRPHNPTEPRDGLALTAWASATPPAGCTPPA